MSVAHESANYVKIPSATSGVFPSFGKVVTPNGGYVSALTSFGVKKIHSRLALNSVNIYNEV